MWNGSNVFEFVIHCCWNWKQLIFSYDSLGWINSSIHTDIPKMHPLALTFNFKILLESTTITKCLFRSSNSKLLIKVDTLIVNSLIYRIGIKSEYKFGRIINWSVDKKENKEQIKEHNTRSNFNLFAFFLLFSSWMK